MLHRGCITTQRAEGVSDAQPWCSMSCAQEVCEGVIVVAWPERAGGVRSIGPVARRGRCYQRDGGVGGAGVAARLRVGEHA